MDAEWVTPEADHMDEMLYEARTQTRFQRATYYMLTAISAQLAAAQAGGRDKKAFLYAADAYKDRAEEIVHERGAP